MRWVVLTDEVGSDDREVVEHIDRLHGRICAEQRDLLRHVAEWDKRGRWRDDGCRDLAAWLAARFGISNWSAARWVHAAHALEHLPAVSAAFSAGEICLDKVLELTRIATAETEERLLTWARRVSAAAIRHKADLEHRRSPAELQDADRARFLRWWYFDDGARMGLEGEFPAAHGAAIAKAISRMAERVPALPTDTGAAVCPEDAVEQRRADALLAVATAAIADDADSERATIVVHTTRGCPEHDHGSEIDRGPVIDRATEERLSCDARIQPVEEDRHGRVLGIGRTSRNIPPWLERVLRGRDRSCTFPGCGMKMFLQAHHIKHWEHGGATDIDNLTLVCSFHHKLVHEFGWKVKLAGAVSEWFRPSGARYAPGPDPPAVAAA